MKKYKGYIISWGIMGCSYCAIDDLEKDEEDRDIHYVYDESEELSVCVDKCKKEIDGLLESKPDNTKT